MQGYLTKAYSDMQIFFLPFSLHKLDLKEIVKTLIDLEYQHPELCLNLDLLLHAVVPYFQKTEVNQTYTEFVFGKTFAYYFKTRASHKDLAA